MPFSSFKCDLGFYLLKFKTTINRKKNKIVYFYTYFRLYIYIIEYRAMNKIVSKIICLGFIWLKFFVVVLEIVNNFILFFWRRQGVEFWTYRCMKIANWDERWIDICFEGCSNEQRRTGWTYSKCNLCHSQCRDVAIFRLVLARRLVRV